MIRSAPDVVVPAAPGARVRSRRTTLERGAPEDERSVDQQAVHRDLVEIGVFGLPEQPAAPQLDRSPPKLGRAFRVERAQEVTDSIRLVFGHQGWTTTGEAPSDRLQLGQLVVWTQADVPVGEDVRPGHPPGD